MNVFIVVFYQPLFNLLVLMYNLIPGHDIGVAIVLLTILIRALLYPLTKKSITSQKALSDLQPKIKELQTKYKDQQEVLAKELMNLYKSEQVNPMSGCLPILVQLPFLIALYRVFIHGLKSESFELLYGFVAHPGIINTISLGFFDLLKPSIPLAVLAALAQYWQTHMMMRRKSPLVGGKHPEGSKDEDMLAAMNKQMLYVMPVMTGVIGASLPGGLALYWFVTTLLMGVQQWYIFRSHGKKPETTTTDLPLAPS